MVEAVVRSLFFLAVLGPVQGSGSRSCCASEDCATTCSLRSGQWCFRYSGITYPPDQRFCSFQAPPCRFARNQKGYIHSTPSAPSVSPLLVEVERSGEVRTGVVGCGEDLCNRCAYPVEKCRWPGRKPLNKLKCSCTPEGMNSTWLAKRNPAIDFSGFCRENVCSFQEIEDRFDNFRFSDPHRLNTLSGFLGFGYTCALTRNHPHLSDEPENVHIQGVRYGCDMEINYVRTGNSATGRRLVEFITPERYTVECNDADRCNDIQLYTRQSPPVADLSLFRSCPFEVDADGEEICQENVTPVTIKVVSVLDSAATSRIISSTLLIACSLMFL